MEQQPETTDQVPTGQPAEIAQRQPVLTQSQALYIFLACLLIGVVGTLVGVVPLIAVAMAGAVVVSFLA